MKKFCTMLGLSLFLTGCFEQPKVESEKAETATTAEATAQQNSTEAVEKTETTVATAEKGEEASPETSATSAEKATETPASDAEKSPTAAVKDEASSEKTAETATSSAEKTQPAAEPQAVKNSQNFGKASNTESKPKAHKEAAKTVHKKKGFDYNSNQLSPEEKRLGITEAVIVTEQDIQQMKYKCRYPLMNEKELETYNCPVKPVKID